MIRHQAATNLSAIPAAFRRIPRGRCGMWNSFSVAIKRGFAGRRHLDVEFARRFCM